jgi:hypothetical protein
MFASKSLRVKSVLKLRIDCVQDGLRKASGKIFLAWEASIPSWRMAAFSNEKVFNPVSKLLLQSPSYHEQVYCVGECYQHGNRIGLE